MNIKQHIPMVCICLVCFAGGYLTGDHYASRETITVTEEKPVYVQGKTVTETKIAYVPKETIIEKCIDAGGNEVKRETVEKTDLQADIGKTDFTIKVNGQEQTFTKTDDERFVFDKNKLALSQTSRVTMDINVPTWDKTKRWAVGVGASDSGAAYTLDFPIGKSDRFGGWVYGSADEKAVGVKMKF